MTSGEPSPPRRRAGNPVTTYFPALTLLTVAAVLGLGPWDYAPPIPPPTPVPAWATQTDTVYHPTLKPVAHFANRTFECSTCHSKYRSDTTRPPMLYMHDNIVLEHGLNDRCLNCHNNENRNALVDDWGRQVPYDEPYLLCRKCHGPVYRDWLHGSHGRTSGYWDTRKGEKVRAICLQCHNPHQPPFPPIQAAPGPNTLRMGDRTHSEADEKVHHPLRVYRQGDTEGVLRLERPVPRPVEEP